MKQSDKLYWHRYIPEYERLVFSQINPTRILEFGVDQGASIMWLTMRFPKAKIIGVDILPTQPTWPKFANVSYVELDQGDREAVKRVVNAHQYDLIIEDGSHLPEHQSNCLIEGLQGLKAGGFYILEDAHTSYPRISTRKTNAFHLLLAIQNIKDLRQPLDRLKNGLYQWSHFTEEEVKYAFERIDTIHLYKRTSLPLSCYNCGGSKFDYSLLTCQCGIDLYENYDSMSFMVKVK